MNEATPIWHDQRRRIVGGSEIAALLGEGDGFVTEYGLYHEKRGTGIGKDTTEQMQLGSILEPAIIEATRVIRGWPSVAWRDVNPSTLRLAPGVTMIQTERGPLLRHESGLGGTPDGLVLLDPLELLETKFASFWALRDWPGKGEELPTGYLCQVWDYLGLLGLPRAKVAVFSGELTTYEVEAHPGMFALMCDLARKFWARVDAGDEPEPDPWRDADGVARRFKQRAAVGIVDRSDERAFVDLVAEYHAARNTRLSAEKHEAAKKTQLLHRLGTAEVTVAGALTVSVSNGKITVRGTKGR